MVSHIWPVFRDYNYDSLGYLQVSWRAKSFWSKHCPIVSLEVPLQTAKTYQNRAHKSGRNDWISPFSNQSKKSVISTIHTGFTKIIHTHKMKELCCSKAFGIRLPRQPKPWSDLPEMGMSSIFLHIYTLFTDIRLQVAEIWLFESVNGQRWSDKLSSLESSAQVS